MGLASAKSGAWPRPADGLVPLSGALRSCSSSERKKEESSGVRPYACRFRVAFVVVFVERVVGLGFLYNSYNSALVDLRGAWDVGVG